MVLDLVPKYGGLIRLGLDATSVLVGLARTLRPHTLGPVTRIKPEPASLLRLTCPLEPRLLVVLLSLPASGVAQFAFLCPSHRFAYGHCPLPVLGTGTVSAAAQAFLLRFGCFVAPCLPCVVPDVVCKNGGLIRLGLDATSVWM